MSATCVEESLPDNIASTTTFLSTPIRPDLPVLTADASSATLPTSKSTNAGTLVKLRLSVQIVLLGMAQILLAITHLKIVRQQSIQIQFVYLAWLFLLYTFGHVLMCFHKLVQEMKNSTKFEIYTVNKFCIIPSECTHKWQQNDCKRKYLINIIATSFSLRLYSFRVANIKIYSWKLLYSQ